MCLSTSNVFVAVAKESSFNFRLLVGSSSSIFCLYASGSTSPPVFRFHWSSLSFFFFFFCSAPLDNFSISIPTCLRRNLRNSVSSSIVVLFFKKKTKSDQLEYFRLCLLFYLTLSRSSVGSVDIVSASSSDSTFFFL